MPRLPSTLIRGFYLDRNGSEHRMDIRTTETFTALANDARELSEGVAAALWHRQCELLSLQLVSEAEHTLSAEKGLLGAPLSLVKG